MLETMLNGVGADIVDIERFRAVLREKKDHFVQNTFSTYEQDYCSRHADPAMHYAGTFAAKEAVQKAAQEFSLPLNQIEIRRLASGKPEVHLRGQADPTLLISISHTETTAIAIAVKQIL